VTRNPRAIAAALAVAAKNPAKISFFNKVMGRFLLPVWQRESTARTVSHFQQPHNMFFSQNLLEGSSHQE